MNKISSYSITTGSISDSGHTLTTSMKDVERMQKEGLDVEVQFQMSDERLGFLVLGRQKEKQESFVYLASPYTHPDPKEREYRYQKAVQAAAYLMSQGHVVFSPIAHNHNIASIYGLPVDWTYWKGFCKAFLGSASKMVILQMQGVETSEGVKREIEFCKENGIPMEDLFLGEVMDYGAGTETNS